MSQYAQIADLTDNGINASALVGSTIQQQNQALINASTFCDDYLADVFTLPILAPYPLSLILQVCQLAPWFLMKVRGFSPEGDPTVRMGYEDSVRWLERVSRGMNVPQGVIDSSGSTDTPFGPLVCSDKPRGW